MNVTEEREIEFLLFILINQLLFIFILNLNS